jgi:hypothetical protein
VVAVVAAVAVAVTTPDAALSQMLFATIEFLMKVAGTSVERPEIVVIPIR